MATLKQLEKHYGPFDMSEEYYCLALCRRCGKETEPYRGHWLWQDEDGRWFCPVKEGYTELPEGYDYRSFGPACARKVLAGGEVPETTPIIW